MRFQSVQSITWLQMIWNMKHKTYGLRLWYFYDGFSFFVELDSLLLNEKELYTAGYRVCKSMMVKKVKYWKDKSTPHIFNSRICCGFWSLHQTQRYGNLSDVYRGQNLLQTSAVDQGSDTRGSCQGLNSLLHLQITGAEPAGSQITAIINDCTGSSELSCTCMWVAVHALLCKTAFY